MSPSPRRRRCSSQGTSSPWRGPMPPWRPRGGCSAELMPRTVVLLEGPRSEPGLEALPGVVADEHDPDTEDDEPHHGGDERLPAESWLQHGQLEIRRIEVDRHPRAHGVV